ncbi:MAG TPA: nodulation protein NfeD [Alphaproteobacteria bacterium]
MPAGCPASTRARVGRRIGPAAAFVLAALLGAGPAASAANDVYLVDVKGAIGVATSRYIDRALRRAGAEHAQVVVLRLDTPGGLVSSTREIIQSIVSSEVPVVVYVAPGGARAASAGTYISYAAHVAAMAPGTNIGAATPIAIGAPGLPSPSPPPERRGAPGDAKSPPEPAAPAISTAERKSLNDAIAFIRSLAQLRGRNAEWAEQAVRDAATLTAQDALRQHVVDIVAADLPDLLAQLDGRQVTIAGAERRLATKAAATTVVAMDGWTEALAVITDPNVAYLLLLAGIYGLAFEFISPGVVLPGIVGGISLILALAAMTVLPVNYAGLALILLGVALMVAEAATPGVIALGIGGVVAFVAGALFLFEPGSAEFGFAVGWPVIAAAAAASVGFLVFVIGSALRVRRRPVTGGAEDMINRAARVVAWQDGAGQVTLSGELWSARADRSFRPGDRVRIARRDGLKLVVEPDREEKAS